MAIPRDERRAVAILLGTARKVLGWVHEFLESFTFAVK
jgi:hypothetical protein